MAPPNKTNAKAAAGPSLGQQLTPAVIVGAVVLLVGVLGVIYYFALYSTVSEQITTERRRRTELQGQLANARRDLQRYNDDVAELDRARVRAREFARILPEGADMPGFMRNINTLAASSGLQIALIQPSEERAEQYYVRVPVRLEVQGPYLALARFFRSISALPRVINMEDISMHDPTVTNGDVRVHAEILATTFRSLTAQEAAAPRNPQPGANGARPQGGH